jgi:hypothetical protein
MTALRQQTSRARPSETSAAGKQIARRIVTGVATRIGDHGAAYCALRDKFCAFCHALNIPITAFTEACCAGTEASLPLALSNAGFLATLLIELDAIPCPAI